MRYLILIVALFLLGCSNVQENGDIILTPTSISDRTITFDDSINCKVNSAGDWFRCSCLERSEEELDAETPVAMPWEPGGVFTLPSEVGVDLTGTKDGGVLTTQDKDLSSWYVYDKKYYRCVEDKDFWVCFEK